MSATAVKTGRERLVGTRPDKLQLPNDGHTLEAALGGTPGASLRAGGG
jgi:hypothetical protein